MSRYLKDPFLRPILELDLNGVVNFGSALTLFSFKFIRIRSFTILRGPAKSERLEYVELTADGATYLNVQTASIPAVEKCFDSLCAAIKSYYAIDRGNGLVSTRDALDAAIEIEDGDLLSRLKKLPDGKQILPHGTVRNRVTETERMEMAQFWDQSGERRNGARIIDLQEMAREKS